MKGFQSFNNKLLSNFGLNLQAIFNIDDLPQGLVQLEDGQFTQLLLFAHGGRGMWSALQEAHINTENPVDDFSKNVVVNYFESELPENKFKIIYPGPTVLGLRKLGELAGWHYDSPFRIGINEQWGSWFAYRAVVLADTNLEPTQKLVSESPCISCVEKSCIQACPAAALNDGGLALEKCIGYRKLNDSQCQQTCLSRVACPVASQHRYTEEQINYHYSVSMETIRKYY